MDRDQTSERLLCAAMEIFSAKGYEGASTRDICAAAGIGNASIHYHFGDKAAIYHALFARLIDEFEQSLRGSGMDLLSGREALHRYYLTLLQPWATDPSRGQRFHLYLREEFQPTGIVNDLLPRPLRLQLEMLGAVVAQALQIKEPDAAAQRLILALQGLPMGYVMLRRSLGVVLPKLTRGAHWLDQASAHLADAGWALIEAEQGRRAASGRGQ